MGSVEKALESFDNITLIAGGKDKGGSYAPLAALVQERVRHLILIGEAAERMRARTGVTDRHPPGGDTGGGGLAGRADHGRRAERC